MESLLKQHNLTISESRGTNGININSDGKNISLEYETIPQKLRGYYLIERELNKGNTIFGIHQKPHFELCGPMPDLSMNALMTVDALCELIEASAKLGLNMVMLYMEDVFELDGYPKFGYMTGKYSIDELKKIDDFADKLGVEIIPAIQTLAHFTRYIPWGEVPAENATVLLPDNEEVYAFIEAQIKTMRKAFRTNRIHIGMDEANGLGHGRSFREKGLENTLDIFNRHLKKVIEIAGKYGYEPMIWADMYLSETDPNYYYEEDGVIPQHAIDSAPARPELIFWDYYHTNYSYYDKKFIQYERFPNKTGFAGGIWTLDGYVPNYRYTVESSIPALKASIDHGVKTVIATMWGALGEAHFNIAKSGLAVFSEYCYLGNDCTLDDIDTAAEYISGEQRELLYAISDYYNGEIGSIRVGTALFYCDLLLDTLCKDIDFDVLQAKYENSLNVIEKYPDAPFYTYYRAMFETVILKLSLMKNLRKEYLKGNKAYLTKAADVYIPKLIDLYDNFYTEFTLLWKRYNKPFMQERIINRFGAMNYRLKSVRTRLLDYVHGRTATLEELDEERISGINVCWKDARFYMHL